MAALLGAIATAAPTFAFLDDGGMFTGSVESEDGQAVYVGSLNNRVYAFWTGSPRCSNDPSRTCDQGCTPGSFCTRVKWIFKTGSDVLGDPIIAKVGPSLAETIFIGSKDAYIYALDPNPPSTCIAESTREIATSNPACFRWKAKIGAIKSRPVLRDSSTTPAHLFVTTTTSAFGQGGATLFVFDADSGPNDPALGTKQPLGRCDVPGRLRFNPMLSADGRTLYVGSDPKGLFAVDVTNASSPQIIWDYDFTICPDGKCSYQRGGDLGADGTIYAGGEGSGDTAKVIALRHCGVGEPGQRVTVWPGHQAGLCQQDPARCDFCLSWTYHLMSEKRAGTKLSLSGNLVFRGTRHEKKFDAMVADSDDPLGELQWEYYVGAPIQMTPTIHPGGPPPLDGMAGTVFLGVTKGGDAAFGMFYALDPEPPNPPAPACKWKFSTTSEFRATPGLSRSLATVYTGDDRGYFYALGVVDGHLGWCFDINGALSATGCSGIGTTQSCAAP
jgi:outer membrane protein assembly factor BamB